MPLPPGARPLVAVAPNARNFASDRTQARSAAPRGLPPGARRLPAGARRLGAAPAPAEVLNESGVTEDERFLLNTLAPSPASAVPWLQKRGYEARLHGDEVILRKPGQSVWRKIEPTGFLAGKGFFGKLAEIARDLGPDAADEYASLVATIKGGTLGAGGGTALAGPVGGVVGGIGGAAAGSAAAEAARRGAGRLAGFEETGAEFGQGLKEAAIAGAAAEGTGRVLGAAARGVRNILRAPSKTIGQELQRPAQIARAKTAQAQAQELNQAALAKQRTAKIEFKEAKGAEDLRLLNSFKNASDEAERAIRAGKSFVGTSESATLTKTAMRREGASGGRLDVPYQIASPDFGITAAALSEAPAVGHILRKHFGDEFVPIFAEGGKRGSHAMKQRADRLSALIAQRGPSWVQEASRNYIQDLAAYMLAHPEFTAGAPSAVMAAVKAGAAGTVTPTVSNLVTTTLQTRLSGRLVSPRLRAAKEALEEADLGKLKTATAFAQAQQGVTALRPPGTRGGEPTMAVLGPLARRLPVGGGLIEKLVGAPERAFLEQAGKLVERGGKVMAPVKRLLDAHNIKGAKIALYSILRANPEFLPLLESESALPQ